MRAELAPFAVDVLLALAGLGILLGIGLVPRRPATMLAALGLAYLTGTAVVSVALIALLTIGVPFTLWTFFVVVFACAGIGAWAWRRRPPDPTSPDRRWWRLPWRSWPADVWIVGAFVLLFGAFAAVGMASASKMPLGAWDAWSIWARKAQMLSGHDSLVGEFWTSSSYSWVHLDYPLLHPVWEALHFRAAGSFETQALLRHVWLLLPAFVWAVAFLLREQVRPLVWAPLLLLVAAAPGVWRQLLTGYADVPLAIFACLGAIALALWLVHQKGGQLALAAIMLAAAVNTKNEGLLVAVALLLVAYAIALAQGLRLRPLLLAVAAVVAAILPWRIWTAVQGIEGDMPVGKGLTPGFLLDRTDRVWPAIDALGHQLGDPDRWLYLLPLATLVIAASLISGVGRRVAGFYLASMLLICAGLVWSYWISPNPIDWHLDTSVNRVASLPVFVCVAAVVHLSGLLLSTLSRPIANSLSRS
jgi:hypothetical protein